jgi:phosphoglycolate phosphatase
MTGLVMFDYDGVIVDSFDVFRSAFREACEKCSGYKTDSDAGLMELFDGNLFEGMKNLGMNRQEIDHTLKTFETIISKHLDSVNFFSGMAEALKAISLGNRIFIITSNVSHIVSQVLKKNGVDFVEDVLGAEKEKSKTKKISDTMTRYANHPAYYVGDTSGDMIEGRSAGAVTVAVTWGWHDAGKLREASPDFIVSSPAELTALICAAG